MDTYPGDCPEAGLRLFRSWLGSRYARATKPIHWESDGAVGLGVLEIARRWTLQISVVNTLKPDTDPEWEAARGALEAQLDRRGLNLAVFVPRNAPIPGGEPGLSEFADAALSATPSSENRLEINRPVSLRLRRTAADGSVVTAIGGLSSQWARFTERVSGTFQLNSAALFRMPADEAKRDAMIEDIVASSSAAEVDAGVSVTAVDAWTAVPFEEGQSIVLGTPRPENDEWSASLRRNSRKLLRVAREQLEEGHTAYALVILGAATYADEERLSWVLRGMDPSHYSGYGIVSVIADGMVKTILEPPAGSLPWEA